MKITIEEKGYEIDLERAKELGLCEEVAKEITDFNVGDVFEYQSEERVLIVQSEHGDKSEHGARYNIAGLNGLEVFSDFGSGLLNHQQMLKWLRDNEYSFVANINDDIEELIKNA
jgi:hypothetical protein